MKRVEIYTRSWCGFCQRAKQLLEREGIEYQEYDVESVSELLAEMLARADGRRSVPQIFIDGDGIGGYDELFAASISGTLRRKLEGPADGDDGDSSAG